MNDQALYKSGAFRSFSAGNSNELVLSHVNGKPLVLSAGTIQHLSQCTHFATLREHKERICANRGFSPEQAGKIERDLRECVLHGLLLSKKDILSRGIKPVPMESKDTKIVSIGIPTRTRVAKLKKSAGSFAHNAATYGRAITLVVMDDSSDPAVREQCKEALRAVLKLYGIPVFYAGYEEKRSYAEKLIGELGGRRDEVEFALFGNPESACTPGANRNCLLLDTMGGLFLSFDDDAECLFETHSEKNDKTTLALGGDKDPTQIRYLEDRNQAYKLLDKQPGDVIAMHEAYLGKSLSAVLGDAARHGQVDCDQMCSHLATTLLEGRGTIMASFNGLVGDSGMSSRMAALSLVKRGVRTPAQFEYAASCREMVRSVTVPTIWHGSGWMNFASGLDNRDLLPPFMPVERSEDAIFISLVRILYKDGYFAHLPYALLHDSESRCGYSNHGLYRSKLYDIILACMQSSLVVTAGAARENANTLESLGRHLVEAGSLEPHAFNELVAVALLRDASRMLQEYQKLLRDPRLAEVAPILDKEYAQLMQNSVAPDFMLPVEFAALGRDKAQYLTQKLIVQFGKLLMLWPRMVQTARKLKNSGERLAHAV